MRRVCYWSGSSMLFFQQSLQHFHFQWRTKRLLLCRYYVDFATILFFKKFQYDKVGRFRRNLSNSQTQYQYHCISLDLHACGLNFVRKEFSQIYSFSARSLSVGKIHLRFLWRFLILVMCGFHDWFLCFLIPFNERIFSSLPLLCDGHQTSEHDQVLY